MYKVKITFILFIGIFGSAFCQAKLGYSVKELMAEFPDETFKEDTSKNGTKYLWFENDQYLCLYYLTNKRNVYTTVIEPKNNAILNYMTEKYNNKYVIINNKNWKYYSENGIMKIELIFGDHKPYFSYSLED